MTLAPDTMVLRRIIAILIGIQSKVNTRHAAIALVVATALPAYSQPVIPRAEPAGPVANPGAFPVSIQPMENALLVVAHDGIDGYRLMRVSLDTGAPVSLADFRPRLNTPGPQDLVVAGSQAFFVTKTPAVGRELWRTDGTREGTRLVRDIVLGPENTDIQVMRAYRGGLLFRASDAVHGVELWFSDGTEAGTAMVRDIVDGSDGSGLVRLVVDGAEAFFRADRPAGGNELWATSGDEATTRRMHPDGPRGIREFIVPSGRIVYADGDSPAQGHELWVIPRNGETGPVLLDLNPGPADSNPAEAVAYRGTLYFQAITDAAGKELWRSDGTSAGTHMITDIVAGPGGSDPYMITGVNDFIFFTANDGVTGRELWITDGTNSNTRLVADLWPGLGEAIPYDFARCREGILFSANDSVHGEELWYCAPGEQPVLVRDIHPGAASSSPYGKISANGVVYFAADDGLHGSELWRSDGTAEGTYLFADIALPAEPAPSSNPQRLTALRDSCIFVARAPAAAMHLLASDGTDAGTIPLLPPLDIDPNAVSGFVPCGNGLCAAAMRRDRQVVLLRTDGTPEGSAVVPVGEPLPFDAATCDIVADEANLVLRVNHANGESHIYTCNADFQNSATLDVLGETKSTVGSNILVWNHHVVFTADSNVYGVELWRLPATGGEAVLVADLVPGPAGAMPREITVWNSRLCFTAERDGGTRTLYSVETLDAAPRAITSAGGGPYHDPHGLCATSIGLCFSAADDSHGYEFWRVDGDSLTASMVRDLYPGPASSAPHDFTELSGRVYFAAEDPHVGVELWVTVGTPVGTSMVDDLFSGAGSAAPVHLTACGDYLVGAFRGRTKNGISTAHEPYVLSQKPGGLRGYAEVRPGPAGGMPREFCLAGKRIFFTADDGINGRELWTIDPASITPRLVTDLLARGNR